MSSPRKLLLALAMVANAISFDAIAQFVGSTSGIFQNSTGPAGKVVSGEGTSSFSWGTGPSSVTFIGRPSFSSGIGTTFEVGSIAFHNGTNATGSSADTVDLALTLNFTAPSMLASTSTYTLRLINTPNIGDANANADILQFPSELPAQVFTIDGVEYTLALDVGTVTGSGFTSQHSFHVLEGATATATLVGTILGSEVLATGFRYPQGVAIRNGVLFIADRNGHTVWKKILATGAIEPLAGTGVAQVNNGQTVLVPGQQGYNGDGISAIQAKLNGPAGVAVDANGNVFVADSGNHIIRMINTSGMITTVAGTPKTLPPVVVGADGQLQLAVGNGGPATQAFLNGPRGVAVGADGNVYIADTMDQQVRKFTIGGAISAVAGLAGTTGFLDGPASTAILNDPRGVAVGSDGTVYIADVGNNRIRKVTTSGVVSSVAAGTLRAPAGVAVGTDGTLYIADTSNHRVRRLAPDGSVTTVAGTGIAGAATASQLNTPVGVALDTNADLYIGDQVNNRVLRVDFTP